MNYYDSLLTNIDRFIRKYYLNKLVKGLLILSCILISSFLSITSLEFFLRFNSFVRAFLLLSFISINLYIIIFYIFLPLLKLYSFGKRISREQASLIIGSFFPEIKDKLLNTLQLTNQLAANSDELDLLKASIDQKSKSIHQIPFISVIDLNQNKRFFKILLPLFFLFFLIGVFYPSLIVQGSKRVVYFDTTFEIEAPFHFSLLNQTQFISEGDDVTLNIQTLGDMLPDKVILKSSLGSYVMSKNSKIDYSYVIPHLTDDIHFHFEGNGFLSKTYTIKVIPKSIIGVFDARLNFPSYLGRVDQFIKNSADLEIPEGTIVTWNIVSKNTKSIAISLNNTKTMYTNPSFSFSRRIKNNQRMFIELINEMSSKKDTLTYNIKVTKDFPPEIFVTEKKDSISDGVRYFNGSLADDYGLSKLTFIYTLKSKTSKVVIPITSGTHTSFSYAFDFRRENISMDDDIIYFFEIYDNDGVNGPKVTRSEQFTYHVPSLDEVNELRDQKQETIRDNLQSLLQKSKQFENDIEKLKKDIINDNTNEWSKQNQIQQLKAQRESLENELQSLQMQLSESLDEKSQLTEIDKDLIEKQDLIQELLNQVMDDELKKLLDKLQDLIKNETDNSELDSKVSKLETKSQDMQKQLDRSLEMLKKMQVNEKIDAIENELKELAKDQEKVKNITEDKKMPNDVLEKKQDQINKRFDEIKEDLNQMNDLNKSLSKPLEMNNTKENEQSIENELNKAKENISESNEKKAVKNQQKAADQLEKLASDLNKSQQKANKQQKGEDIDMIRALLENLVSLSFDQEDILKGFSSVNSNQSVFTQQARNQAFLIDKFRVIEDSLLQLSKRQPKSATFIDNELNSINASLSIALSSIDEHTINSIPYQLQYVMTGFNNLALLLNESLQQLQQEMKGEGGSGSCANPKSGKSGESGFSDMKEILKKQLEMLEKGKQDGGTKPNGQQKGSSGLNGKQISKMVSQQYLLRQQLEKMRHQMNKQEVGSGKLLTPLIKEIDQQQIDLLNKNSNANYIKRQKEILTRLLESEKAFKEKGMDEKRQSSDGKNHHYSNLKPINQYTIKSTKQIEVIRISEPEYRKYYKDKINSYFNEVL